MVPDWLTALLSANAVKLNVFALVVLSSLLGSWIGMAQAACQVFKVKNLLIRLLCRFGLLLFWTSIALLIWL